MFIILFVLICAVATIGYFCNKQQKGEEINLSPRKIFWLIGGFVLFIFSIWASGSILENVGADEVVVIQSPIKGELNWYTTPGLKFQNFGKVSRYPKSFTLWFSASTNQGKKEDESLKTRFYDGGHGMISGSIQIDLPLDNEHLTLLHSKLGSPKAIEHNLVRTVFERSVYMSGPLMSSKESYAEKRPLLIFYIEDQAHNGVYQTTTTDVRMKDPLTGIERTYTVTKIIEDKNSPGGMARQEISPLVNFGLKAYNLNINSILYDEIVEKQIQQQQEAIMAVQTAVARAKEAEQDKLTAEQRGMAAAMKSKWDQETLKAQAITKAQQQYEVSELEAKQRLRVAQLDKEAADQKKLTDIALGEGESKRRSLLVAADNQLEIKLKYWLDAQKAYATAIGNQRWVPEIQMGQTNQPGNAALNLVDLLTAKTAKELNLDLTKGKQ